MRRDGKNPARWQRVSFLYRLDDVSRLGHGESTRMASYSKETAKNAKRGIGMTGRACRMTTMLCGQATIHVRKEPPQPTSAPVFQAEKLAKALSHGIAMDSSPRG
jgi:hypothetical protein